MIIDFHTHIFPEKIAKGTIDQLEKVGGIKASANGTLDGLKRSMKEAGIGLSVVLPVVTKPGQFETINNYAAQITGKDGIISFGGIHPDTEDYRGQLDYIHKLGLKGIKLHPDYQGTWINDEKYIRIIRYAMELGLLVSIHSGVDIGLPGTVHCAPKMAADMLDRTGADEFGNPQIILAHTGGWNCWDDVEHYLTGRNVLFDISFSLGYIREEQLLRIIRNHGADKILFATDCPWGSQKETVDAFRRLAVTVEEAEKIWYKNGKRLLGL